MKNLLSMICFLAAFVSYAQCSCSTGEGGGCSVPSSCPSAHCSTIDGECYCDCIKDLGKEVLPFSRYASLPGSGESSNLEHIHFASVGNCGIINTNYISDLTKRPFKRSKNNRLIEKRRKLISRFEEI